MTDADTLERLDTEQTTDDGDHERFSHYVAKTEWADGYVLGMPVTAICGKVWVPRKDPKNYPVCPECKEVYDRSPDERS